MAAISCFVMPAWVQAQADNHQFNRIDVRNGLSHNQINAILKDEQGFMWFGTMSGLDRYDGYNFKIYRHGTDTNSISDNYIAQIVQGPHQKLWVSTRSGWNMFDPVTEKFNRNALSYLKSLHLPDLSFTDIKKDSAGNFWFVYPGKGLYKVNTSTGKTAFYNAEANGFHSNAVSSFAQNKEGDYWIVYTDGVLEKMSGKNFRIVKRVVMTPAEKKQLFNYNIFVDAQNDLWVYSPTNSEGIFYYKAATDSGYTYNKESRKLQLNNNVVNGITQDDKGLIWIVTDHGGINLLDKSASSVRYIMNDPDDEKSLSSNSVYSLYKDNTGIIWVGTFKKGISYFHPDFIKFPLYKHRPSVAGSLPYDDVNCFAEDAKGNIWIGTNGGGIIYFNRAEGTFTRYQHHPANSNSLSNDVIVSLFIDHEQTLWIGTYFGGLDSYDGKQFTHYRHNEKDPNSLSDDRVWEIFEDSQNRMWIGTLSTGLDLFDRQRKSFHHFAPFSPKSIHSYYVPTIIEDRSGNLWFGTAYGIDLLKKGSSAFINLLNDPRNKNSLSNNNVISILEDSRGHIWVGTRDGLNLLNEDQKSFTVFTTNDGLPDNTILAILEDNHHHIWISTPNGLSDIEVKKSSGKTTIVTRNYDEKDGLQGKEFNESSALKTRKGELIFGGPNGFNLFVPQQVNNHHRPIPIVFTGLQVFNKTVGVGEPINGRVVLSQSISTTKKLTLRYNQNIFSIEFAALDFPNAEKIKYAYILEGFNKDWLVTDARNRKATFTNLDPGNYVFKLRVTNADGTFNTSEAHLNIVVLPPFWQTIWAYLLYILIIAGALLFARHLTLRKERMRFAIEQERREAHRLHELDMLKIKFFTNISHEFRTPLSLILAPLDKIIRNINDNDQKKQLTLVQRNAKRLLNLVNQLLDFRKMEVQEFKLNTSEGDIIYFIKDLTLSFSDVAEKKDIQLLYKPSVAAYTTLFDKDKMEKIVFNLLSNAFRFTPDGGTINVEVDISKNEERKSDVLVLKVRDTGIGIPKNDQEKIFERFFQHDTSGAVMNQGSGIGLAITKEFVKLFDGSITVESEPGKGSCFTVNMPVKQVSGTKTVLQPMPEEPVINTITETAPIAEEEKNNAKKTAILLVEDNEDFRFYLKDNLQSYYQVIEAADGKEGWKKLIDLQPELVVSDIMMPNMNGLELSKKIKSDPRTSHVPVILLTAMASEEQQLEGFQSGANDYITKPFSFEILLSRVKSLLYQRRLMQKAFQKQLEVNPAEITVTPLDEQFIKDALAIVEANISNADFSVEDFSRAMHMSRVALYKKLLSITGRPPLEFIRSIRLKRAAQLLSKAQLSVSEVAYEVGFNNPKYFTRYFKEEFKVLPSQYAAQEKKASGG